MNKFGACVQACISIKQEASHKSEMISQLIFGELYEIIEKNAKWTLIKTDFDNYTGWIDSQQVYEISQNEFQRLKNTESFFTSTALSEIDLIGDKNKILISLGSVLYGQESFKIGEFEYKIADKTTLVKKIENISQLTKIAKICTNSPYLWGGRNIMGFDCSGFVQVIFRLAGVHLLRDSSKQALQGLEIEELKNSKAFDLAFFGENNKIDHVGIIIENSEIIHSSGKVKIDIINEEGIFSKSQKTITHKLICIKRFL